MTIAVDNTTKSFEIVLGAAKTTNDCEYHVVYHDVAARSKQDNHIEKLSHTSGVTSGTTPVTILPVPPNYTTRNISYLSVANADTAAITVTVRVDISGTKRRLIKTTLNVDQTLIYEASGGWQIV